MDAKSLIFGIVIGVFLVWFIREFITETCVPDSLEAPIKILTRQAARWSTAADQDKAPMVAVLHANYGTGYLWALKDIAKDDEIEEVTGIDIKKFEYEIVQTQDRATRKMAKLCPEYAPKRTYLTRIGGEGE